jgi:hypothetical protein
MYLRFVHAITERASIIVLSGVEQQMHRYRINDRRTSTDVIAVGN